MLAREQNVSTSRSSWTALVSSRLVILFLLWIVGTL